MIAIKWHLSSGKIQDPGVILFAEADLALYPIF